MAGELRVILSFLYRLRRRALVLSGLELVLQLLTLGAMSVLVAAALGGLGWVHLTLPWLLAGAVLLVPGVWTARVLWPRLRSVSHPKRAAEWVDRSEPFMQNLTLSALELAPLELLSPALKLKPAGTSGAAASSVLGDGFSPQLIAASIQQAAERVETLEAERLLPLQPLKPWLTSAVLSGLPLALMALLAPHLLETNLNLFLHPPVAQTLQEAIQRTTTLDGPALADITLSLNYPAYLKREPEILENASGEIRAPKGTQVTITARAAFVPVKAELVLAGLAPVTAPVGADGRFTAAFTILSKTSWRMALLQAEGQSPILSRSYPVEMDEDSVPTIEVLNLAESTEVTVNEAVSIAYKAQDDHGLTRIELVVESEKKTTRTRLFDFNPPLDRDEQTIEWYPQPGDIPQGGSAEVWLEAADDDTISGPKLGRSAHYRMVLASDERKREQNLKSKEDLKEALITILGDTLVAHEEPMRNKTAVSYLQELQLLSQDMVKVRQGFVSVRSMMEEDQNEEVVVYKAVLALEKDILEGFERLEEALQDRSQASGQSRVRISPTELRSRRADYIALLESAVLSMESFANMQRMESIMARGQELKKAGQDLRDMIEQAKKSGKQPDMKALMEKLQQMQQQLARMAQDMSQLDRSSAEWYQNPAGETQEVKDSLSELQKALEQGKTDDAMKILEEYLKNTDELMQAMEKMQKEEFKNDREEAGKDMAAVIDGLKDIEDQQKRLVQDSTAVQEQIKRQSGLTQSQLDELNRHALQKVDDMRQAINKSEQTMREANHGTLPTDTERRIRESRDRMNTLEAALKVQDLNRSLQATNESARNFRALDMDASRMERSNGQNMQATREANQSGKKAAESLANDLQRLAEKMDQAQQQAAQQGQGLAGRQQSLQQKGQGLADRLGEYSKDSPVIPGQWGERLKQAGQSMQGAAHKLETGELAGGVAQQQAALQEISQLRKDMEQVQKEMQQQARGKGGSSEQPQGESQGMAQGKSPSQGPPMSVKPTPGGNGNRRENWGRGGVRSDSVDISKDYRAPEEYRREIMEGMKGEAPTRYKRLNREYYEKLVR